MRYEILWFGLGLISGYGLSYAYRYRRTDKKEERGERGNEKDKYVYTIAKRIPLIIDNHLFLEYGIASSYETRGQKKEEMFRIVDMYGNTVVPSGKIISYRVSDNEFFISFSNHYCIRADQDTLFIQKGEKQDIENISYESAINYDHIMETVSKVSLNSPVFDKLYDFISLHSGDSEE